MDGSHGWWISSRISCEKSLLSTSLLLLQVLPMLDALEAHTVKWLSNPLLTAAMKKDVMSTFKARRVKHTHPAQAAAFALDPINFIKEGGR